MVKKRTRNFFLISFLIIGTIFLTFYGMSMAKNVLAPIFLAVLLAMVLSPASNWLEKKGISRGWAAFFSDLIFVLLMFGILVAVGAEIKRVASNANKIEKRVSNLYGKVDSFSQKKFGYNIENPFSSSSSTSASTKKGESQNSGKEGKSTKTKSGQKQSSSSSGGLEGALKKGLTWTLNSLTTFLLLVVYIFFMLLFREKFEKGTLYFVPERNRNKGRRVISDILKDAQHYLVGHLILISVLTALYTIGFTIAGMNGAFTTALLAAVLTLVPYVGTMIGNILALGIAFVTTGNMSAVWIVLGTVAVGQFFESYFLEPYIVGKRMNVNPLFTILSVTIGAAVWGIIGMIVFLPMFSFIKAIADKVPLLHPVGYFIGKEDTSE